MLQVPAFISYCQVDILSCIAKKTKKVGISYNVTTCAFSVLSWKRNMRVIALSIAYFKQVKFEYMCIYVCKHLCFGKFKICFD